MTYIHPDDREVYWDLFEKMCTGKLTEVKMEMRVKYSELEDYHWRESSAYIYERDVKGRPLVILGCSTNIQDGRIRS